MRVRFHHLLVVATLIGPMIAGLGTMRANAQGEVEPLKLGVLLPFTGDLSDFGPPMFNAAELAVSEINEAGGVNGQPIEIVQGDSATAPQQSVEEARRLIEIEGAHALVGPAASGTSQQVAESVTGPGSILEISPSGTSPALTTANDNDFFFRTTISDAAQGQVLAAVTQEQGFATACTMYLNSSYGQGLNDAFVASYEALGGQVTAQVPHEQEQATFTSEIATCTEAQPDVLVTISYPESLGVYLREALESGSVSNFIFSDGAKSPELFTELGWESFAGMHGTNPGAPETDQGAAFDEAYTAAYGAPPAIPYLRESYDAVYLIALAAEKTDSVDSVAMRDALRDLANEPGEVVNPGVEGWQAAVAALDAGTEINYEGAGGPVDLDAAGDVAKGTIVVWQIEGEAIVDVDRRDVDLTEGAASGSPVASPTGG
ncbi:MAG: ABC transporter substrate-binding protein [Thermomicrobiales bacterium]